MDENKQKQEVKLEGKSTVELHTEVSSVPKNLSPSTRSGGNTPSDLGAIKKNLPNARTDKNNKKNTNPSSLNNTTPKENANSYGKESQSPKKKRDSKRKRTIENQPTASNTSPLLNQNQMKNFGKVEPNVSNPKLNSSAPFLNKMKGFLPGKGKIPFLQGNKLLSGLTKKKTTKTSVTEKAIEKKANFDLFAFFQMLPIEVKLIVVGAILNFFLYFVILIIIIVSHTSAADGNRELKDDYILGNYTEAELCEYLEQNGYIATDSEKCEDTNAYKFFTKFKELMLKYEEDYKEYRYQINVELLYETMAYYSADEEFYNRVTEEEIKNLIEASLEQIEENCVIKTYDKDSKTCTTTKYVYPLYEFSLDKYISYLKYGTTSTHPNYEGKPIARMCGKGKNVDYVFGYGLVNTSSSPMEEKSDCPDSPVKTSDYNTKNIVKTSLKALNAQGGVPKYPHVYTGEEKLPTSDDVVVGSGSGKEIAEYALQFVGNPYVWGGNSLTKGVDCSGFVQQVYKHFGITLNRVSKDQAKQGKTVTCDEKDLKAGDLIFYDNPVSHVAIYIGNGKIVHAKGAKYGIVTDKYDYSKKGINICKRIVE